MFPSPPRHPCTCFRGETRWRGSKAPGGGTAWGEHSMPPWGWGGKGESALSLVGASWSLCVGAGGSEASPRRAGCCEARRERQRRGLCCLPRSGQRTESSLLVYDMLLAFCFSILGEYGGFLGAEDRVPHSSSGLLAGRSSRARHRCPSSLRALNKEPVIFVPSVLAPPQRLSLSFLI